MCAHYTFILFITYKYMPSYLHVRNATIFTFFTFSLSLFSIRFDSIVRGIYTPAAIVDYAAFCILLHVIVYVCVCEIKSFKLCSHILLACFRYIWLIIFTKNMNLRFNWNEGLWLKIVGMMYINIAIKIDEKENDWTKKNEVKRNRRTCHI